MKTRLLVTMMFLAACSSADKQDPDPPACGNGVKEGTEQCDDGNLVNGDGCSGACMTESSGARCGDGNVANGEQCDDGNNLAGDGCSATCETEAPVAGTCAMPYDLQLMDDGTGVLVATATGDTTTGTDQIPEAACDGFDSGAGHDHIWKFTLTVASDVIVYTDESTAFDSVIRVMSAPCDATTEISEYGTEDGCSDGEGAAEFLGYVRLPAGTYYIDLDGYTATDVGMYSFEVNAWPTTCGDGVLDPLEFCDDGNSATSDGCSAKCEVEDGWICSEDEPSVCTQDTGSTAVKPAPGDIVLNEFMAADNMSDTNCDGDTTGTADEFVEIVNVSNKTLDMEGVTIADSVIVRHTFPAGVTIEPGKSYVVWNAGTPNCPGVTDFAVASTGQLGLNDAGDTITIATGDATPVNLVSMTYGAATTNVSSNLSPDVTGTSYVLHNSMATTAFSPGKHADGSAF